jgi:hypothetical protein
MTRKLKTAPTSAVRRGANNFDASRLVLGAVAAGVGISAAVMPATGQTVEPAATPASSAIQTAASIPDLSGMWGHPYLWPSFVSPLSGPGPLVNKSRRRQTFGTDGPLAPGTDVLVSNNNQLVADYSNPILKPRAAEAVKKHGESELSGAGTPTPGNQCWPQPLPYIFWNFGVLLLQQADKITIVYDEDHEVRHVRLNEPHPAQVTPSWYGDSVGHYEGDTLVIDTVGIKAERPFAMVDTFGTPYTQALHVVERYRLLDYEAAKEGQERAAKELWRIPGPAEGWAPDPNYRGKGLQLNFTIVDDGVFTMPWSATVTYRRPLAAEWPENVCAENTQWHPGTYSAVPVAEKPDF